MIIYGWKRETAQPLGTIAGVPCPQCGVERTWRFAAARTWYTLFFIPLIPAGKQYFLTCEACSMTFRINSAGASAAQALMPHAAALRAGQITEMNYAQFVRRSGLVRDSGTLEWDVVILPGMPLARRLLIAALFALIGLALVVALNFAVAPVVPRQVAQPLATVLGLVALLGAGWFAFRLTGRAERDLRRRLEATAAKGRSNADR